MDNGTEANGAPSDTVEPTGPPTADALNEAARAIEAIVMVAIDPLPTQVLAQVLELPAPTVVRLCETLAASYRSEKRGFELVEVAGGWRYQSHPELAPYVERYVLDGQSARLSSAALETLAIVAYKQPISRAQVSAIRGVNVDGVLRTLVQRGYVAETGRDPGPGQAVLYGTTPEFLERLGLARISDLPPLGNFVPSAQVVEALEQTLRAPAEAVDARRSMADEADRDVAEGETVAGEPTIDLREHPVGHGMPGDPGAERDAGTIDLSIDPLPEAGDPGFG